MARDGIIKSLIIHSARMGMHDYSDFATKIAMIMIAQTFKLQHEAVLGTYLCM